MRENLPPVLVERVTVQHGRDVALVQLIKDKALPALIGGVERALTNRSRFGGFELDQRATRKVLQ